MARNINKPETNGGIGHNGGGASEETFFKHLGLIVAANGPRDAAAAVVRSARKAARGDGVDLGKLDQMIKMSTWEPEEIRDHFARLHQYAAWMKMPVGSQLDMFEGIPMATRPGFDWKSRGFMAATTKKGVPGVPPPDCPADQMQAWMEGWSEGQAKNAPAQSPPANDLHVVQ